MLFTEHRAEMMCVRNMSRVAFLPLIIAIVIALTACSAAKGGNIVIFERLDGRGFIMELKEFSEKSKCELSLKKNDELQIEVSRKGGKIGLTITGKNGSEPYGGNNLRTGIFTVTVSEEDDYVISITADNATGSLRVKNLGDADDSGSALLTKPTGVFSRMERKLLPNYKRGEIFSPRLLKVDALSAYAFSPNACFSAMSPMTGNLNQV